MREKEIIVEPYAVIAVCSDCGGEFLPVESERILLTDPPQIVHECTDCKRRQNFTRKYPEIRYRRTVT